MSLEHSVGFRLNHKFYNMLLQEALKDNKSVGEYVRLMIVKKLSNKRNMIEEQIKEYEGRIESLQLELSHMNKPKEQEVQVEDTEDDRVSKMIQPIYNIINDKISDKEVTQDVVVKLVKTHKNKFPEDMRNTCVKKLIWAISRFHTGYDNSTQKYILEQIR